MIYYKNMFGLCVIQILLLGVLFVTVIRTSSLPCYTETELEDRAQKKLRHYPQPSDPLPNASGLGERLCPVSQYPSGIDTNDRSISPWRYVYETKKDRFPETIAVAQCLCEGCITFKHGEDGPTENFTYISKVIEQSRIVLKKELCEDGRRYRLVPHSEVVAVGCTCVKPK